MNQELCITDVDILVEYGSHLDVDCNIEGPKINENVTSVVNKLHLQHISTGQCKAKHPLVRMLRCTCITSFGIRLWERLTWMMLSSRELKRCCYPLPIPTGKLLMLLFQPKQSKSR